MLQEEHSSHGTDRDMVDMVAALSSFYRDMGEALSSFYRDMVKLLLPVQCYSSSIHLTSLTSSDEACAGCFCCLGWLFLLSMPDISAVHTGCFVIEN